MSQPPLPSSTRSLEAISVALPADEMSWDLEPAPDVPYVSDLELAVDVTIESRAYREMVSVLLGLLRDAYTRERYRRDIHR